MDNYRLGKIGAALTGISVLAFADSMIVGLFTEAFFASCLSSMFIAVGYIIFTAGISSVNQSKEKRGAGLAAVIFAAVYSVLIFLVYYAQITTVRMDASLSSAALAIIGYEQLGSLFFNYDLLGYAFMGLSTFFLSFVIKPQSSGDRALRQLLRIHGIFFLTCLIMPMFPVFTSDTNSIIGTIILEVWCVYFLPVCILGYRYFRKGKS